MNNTLEMIGEMDILLVEDDFEIGKWLEKRMSKLENVKSIRWETNLGGAFNAVVKNNPDIIILDLKLPDGNGIDLLKKIREEKIQSKVYVFSVSRELRRTCLRLGADNFFDKSTESDKLLECISQTSVL